MASETDPYQESEQSDANKMSAAYMLRRYQPTAGRADRMATNIPGGHTDSFGTTGDHLIGHGGSN
jgi:hypothetical protein